MKLVSEWLLRTVRSQLAYPAILSLAGFAIVVATSGSLSRGLQNQLTSLFILMAVAIAWNLVGGYGGQFSLGHSIFVGIGGYGTTLLLTYFDWPLIPVLIAASVLSSIIGVVIAFPLLRLRGPYLAIGSLGMALAAYGWMINWDFTNASSSYNVPMEALLAIDELYIYSAFLVLIALLSTLFMIRSPIGLRLIALRDDENGAASLGVYRVRTLIPFWALSGFLSGLAGALYALQRGTLTVDAAFATQFSLDSAIISVLGGLGTLAGPVVGAFLVYYLRFFTADFANYALVVEAIVVILVVRFFPQGIMGILYKARRSVLALLSKKTEKAKK